MITPLDIENKKFAKQMVNGYSVNEVDDFLDEVTISYEDLSVIEVFNNYSDMKNYISKFKKEFEHNLLLVHEEFEKALKAIEEKQKRDVTKSFYDADKKVQSEVLKHKKSKK